MARKSRSYSLNEPARAACTEALLERLVALNAKRAAEVAQGPVRWLQPEFQDPVQCAARAAQPVLTEFDTGCAPGGGERGGGPNADAADEVDSEGARSAAPPAAPAAARRP